MSIKVNETKTIYTVHFCVARAAQNTARSQLYNDKVKKVSPLKVYLYEADLFLLYGPSLFSNVDAG